MLAIEDILKPQYYQGPKVMNYQAVTGHQSWRGNGLTTAPVAECGHLRSLYCTSVQILTLAELGIMTNSY